MRLKIYKGGVEIGSCALVSGSGIEGVGRDTRNDVTLRDGDELSVMATDIEPEDERPTAKPAATLGVLERPKPLTPSLHATFRLSTKRPR